ncbi:MAG: hypothetical protein ACI4E1_02440 [Lachnospira sp.]
MEKNMDKEKQKRKLIYACVYIVAIIIYLISINHNMNKRINFVRITEGLDADFCLIDMMGLVFGVARNFIIYIISISLIIQLKNSFRSTVILQYKSRIAYWGSMIKKCILNALGNTLVLSAVTFIQALLLSDSVNTNWMEKDSFMVAQYGEPDVFYVISSAEGIAQFIIMLFIIALFVGIVVILSWFIVNPVLGVLSVFVLLGLETASKPPLIKLFFAYTNIDNTKIFYYGTDYAATLICVSVWMTGLILCSILVIRKKNLLY